MATTTDAFTAWVNNVHALGGVATVWPFNVGDNAGAYGTPAARFPADVFATLSNAGQLPMANGVQFNTAGTWVYVLSSVMMDPTTGQPIGDAVNNSAATLVDPTQAEIEQNCSALNNCPTNFEQELMTWAKIGAIGLGAFIALKVIKEVA